MLQEDLDKLFKEKFGPSIASKCGIYQSPIVINPRTFELESSLILRYFNGKHMWYTSRVECSDLDNVPQILVALDELCYILKDEEKECDAREQTI